MIFQSFLSFLQRHFHVQTFRKKIHLFPFSVVATTYHDLCVSFSTAPLDDRLHFSLPTKVIFTSAMLFTFLVSVIGNSLVIYVITKHHSMRTSTNCLIMNLAICDLFITVIGTPTSIAYLYIGKTWFNNTTGEVMCTITTYGSSMSLYCSILNLVAIAIDRFLAVTRPLTYKLSSKWIVTIGIPVMWFIAALIPFKRVLSANIQLHGEDKIPKCNSGKSDKEEPASLVCILGSFIALIVLYSVVCYRLWRRNIPGEVSSNKHALAIRTARKVTVLMISVVIVFVVSWAPTFAVVLSRQLLDGSIVHSSIISQYPFLVPVTYWLVLNSSACNPVLYFIFIQNFREGLKTACSRCRLPELRLCRFGGFYLDDAAISRQTLNVFAQEQKDIELTVYSTFSQSLTSSDK